MNFEQMKMDAALNDNIARRPKMDFDTMRKLAEMSAFHSKCDRVDEAVAFIRAFYKSIWTRSTTAEDEQKFENTMADLEFLLDEAMGKHIDFHWKDM